MIDKSRIQSSQSALNSRSNWSRSLLNNFISKFIAIFILLFSFFGGLFLIPDDFDIGLVDIFGVGNGFLIWNRDGNFSNNRDFLNIGSGNGNCSGDGHLFENGILDMMNIILLIILLNNRLSDEFFSRHLHSFSSGNIIHLDSLNNWLEHNFLIRLSIDLNVDIFPLNDWLNESLILDFSSGSGDGFDSILGSQNGFSSDRIQIHNLIFSRNEFQLLFIIDDFFFINWLEIDFSGGGLVFLGDHFLSVFGGSDNFWIVDHLTFSFLDIQ